MTKKKTTANSLNVTPPSEHVINIVKALISAIPYAGGPLSNLMNDYIPRKKQERLISFAIELKEKLDQIEDRINLDLINTEEFAFLFEQSFKLAMENYHEEKIKSLMALLVNSLTQSEYKADKAEYYLKKIETLSPLHIAMIKFLNDPKKCFIEAGVDLETLRNMDFAQTMMAYFKDFEGVDSMVLVAVFGDLYQMNFSKTDRDYFGQNTATQGINVVSGHLTNLAEDFIRYCTLENQ